jgi:ribosomal protein S18 acetylase RimI-like enzyme
VRLAAPDDVPAVARSLGRAFRDDPIMEWLIPGVDVDERARRVAPFFATDTRIRVREATAWCSGSQEGAALWAAPGHWKTGLVDGLRLALPIIRGSRGRAVAALGALARMEKVHPKEPHWYLAVLGTDPDHQGKGIGAAMLAPVLEACDKDGLPAYLESSKESNVPYYERFGFRVQRDFVLAKKDAPTVWLMWRDPQ